MIILAIAAGVAALTLPASSEYAGQSVEVPYGDLDLSTADGERRLQKRIAYAANAVCASQDGRDLAGREAWRVCHHSALESAKGQFEVALLNARTRMAAASSPSVAGLNKSDH